MQRRSSISRAAGVDSTVDKDCSPPMTSTPSTVTASASLCPTGVGSKPPRMREIDLADLSGDEEEDELVMLDRREAAAKEHQREFPRRL